MLAPVPVLSVALTQKLHMQHSVDRYVGASLADPSMWQARVACRVPQAVTSKCQAPQNACTPRTPPAPGIVLRTMLAPVPCPALGTLSVALRQLWPVSVSVWQACVVIPLFRWTSLDLPNEVPRATNIKVPPLNTTSNPGFSRFTRSSGIVLKVMLGIVPIILRKMIIFGGTTSLSAVDFGVVRRFYILQVCISVGAWVNGRGGRDHLPVGGGLRGGAPLLHPAGVC